MRKITGLVAVFMIVGAGAAFGQTSRAKNACSVSPSAESETRWGKSGIRRQGESFKLTVDYGKTLQQMVAAGRYDVVSDDFNRGNFVLSGKGKTAVKVRLIGFEKGTSLEAIKSELGKKGLRFANVAELLALAAQKPDAFRGIWILSYDALVTDPKDGSQFAPCIGHDYNDRDEKEFQLVICAADWREPAYWYTLAVEAKPRQK